MVSRERVEPGIWQRSTDGKLEIIWRDAGRQHRRTIYGGIKTARAELLAEHAKRAAKYAGEPAPAATPIDVLLAIEARLSEIRDELRAIRMEAQQ
jgi:hypothetical protein